MMVNQMLFQFQRFSSPGVYDRNTAKPFSKYKLPIDQLNSRFTILEYYEGLL
eukprot:TRINITY_DN2226_c1_g1_i1.p4 TRINITY_DN2226_c1_g1~~TRINITY_DN2226_c1_g1_i1.p4  ORF type:complete len:52 (-),score=4.91 TRINITY_DN2226_c1_g1_i1:677-832(-)